MHMSMYYEGINLICRLPPLTTPKASYLTDVIADAAFIAILIFYADMTVEKVFAKKHGYTIYPNQVSTWL